MLPLISKGPNGLPILTVIRDRIPLSKSSHALSPPVIETGSIFVFALLAMNIAPGFAFVSSVLVIPPSGKIPKIFPFFMDLMDSFIVDGPTLFLSVKIAPYIIGAKRKCSSIPSSFCMMKSIGFRIA